MTRKVLILGYPGVQALDVFGPSEVFATASLALLGQGRGEDGYHVGWPASAVNRSPPAAG